MPAWWDKKWGKDQICPITHTRLRPGRSDEGGEPYTIRLDCGHRFYRKAIYMWIINDQTGQFQCPMCREKIDLGLST